MTSQAAPRGATNDTGPSPEPGRPKPDSCPLGGPGEARGAVPNSEPGRPKPDSPPLGGPGETRGAALDPQALAEAVAERMWQDDVATRHLGIERLEVGPGHARLRMTVRPEMTNGHGICHGGYIFLLADSTFAFACNSHDQRAVAAGAEIHFVAPAHRGDVLTADGRELFLAGRTGLYDMRVTNQDGRLIAVFRGRSATIRGRIVGPDTPAPADGVPR